MKYNTAAVSLEARQEAFFFDVGSLYEHLETLKDRRDQHGVRYPLAVVLVFVILAKLAGEQEPRGIAQWVELRKEILREALEFDRDTAPRPITYSRILGKAVDVEHLQQAVSRFLLSAADGGRSTQINLDGKALRGTIRAGQKQGLHLLAAYLPDDGIVLMQMEVGSKENEIVTAPRSGKKRSEVSYGISSLSRKQANARKLLETLRKHWMIENGLHYRKDWTLREDYWRLRIGEAAQARAVITNLVVGLALRQGFKYLPDARRKYNAQPLEGLKLILRR